MTSISISRGSLLVSVLLALTACGQEMPGTQVGVEHGGACTLVSSEVLTDLDTVVDSFYDTPREILEEIPGTFTGNLLGAEEVPMDGAATLTVGVSDEQLTLQRYEAPTTDTTEAGTEPGVYCPPQLLLTLDLQLAADGYPSFTDRAEVSITADAEATAWSVWSRFDASDGLDGALPPPAELEPENADTISPVLRVSGGGSSWGVSMTWVSETDDGQGEDGGPSIDQELLFMAQLTRVPESSSP